MTTKDKHSDNEKEKYKTVNEYKLAQEIISRSEADDWDDAKREWEVQSICKGDDPETCACSHTPIFEVCTLVNTKNDESLIVGNHCVTQFMGLGTDKLFRSIAKVSEDRSKALNDGVILYASEHGWINGWEEHFYLDTWRKRKMSMKQLAIRERINTTILEAFNQGQLEQAA
ncbi:hypothetical protein N8766_02510 [bacterium]|nr:hypothetical protein [bacterium]